MAKVVVELKILPSDVSVDLDSLEKKIREKIKVDKISKEPIAFGLVALRITTLVEDQAGEIEKIENVLKTLDDISQVEVLNVSRAYI